MQQRTDIDGHRAERDLRPLRSVRAHAKNDDSAPGVVARISSAIVQIHKRHYGKGPTKARTEFSDDLVVTRLENTLTRAEETLVELGLVDDVRRAREAVRPALEPQFVDCVERLTGRRVRAYVSDIHPATGIVVEIFVLEPSAG